MAEQLRYSNTDSTPGGDGTTNNTTGATRAYASASEWEANEQQDLVAAGDTARVLCDAPSGTADTTVLTISGWTTGLGNGYTVEANTGNEALKTGWDATRYRLSTASAFTIGSGEGYGTYIGLQFETTSSSGGDAAFFTNVGGDHIFKNCRIRAAGAASGLHIQSSSADLITENNIIVGISSLAGSEGIFLDAVNSSLNYNNIIEGWADGVEVDEGTNVFKNNAVFNNIDDFNLDGGTNTIDFNASDDGDGTNSQAPSGGDWANEFNNVAGGDFTLLTGGNLEDNGIGPGSDANVPTTDIDGDTRSGTTCDIGADEISGGVTHQLAGSIDSQSALSGTLNLTQRLSASLNSSSNITGSLRLIQKLSGSLNSSSIVLGTIRLIHGLSGALQSVSSIAGNIRLLQRLKGSINNISALVGNLRLIQRLSGSIESHSHLTGNLSVPTTHSLSGTIESHSNLSGTLLEDRIVETLYFDIDKTESLDFSIDKTESLDFSIDKTESLDFDITME